MSASGDEGDELELVSDRERAQQVLARFRAAREERLLSSSSSLSVRLLSTVCVCRTPAELLTAHARTRVFELRAARTVVVVVRFGVASPSPSPAATACTTGCRLRC